MTKEDEQSCSCLCGASKNKTEKAMKLVLCWNSKSMRVLRAHGEIKSFFFSCVLLK